MRILAAALAVLAATGCAGRTSSEGSGSGSASADTKLEISISTAGSERPTQVWTLRCPDEGTLPNADQACQKLEQVPKPFAPVPKNAACTMIYGGPQIADVIGTFDGHTVSAHFSRGNGCEIARWNRVQFLFPTTG
jgi:Subtilisin inhibitor-like